MRTRCIFGRQLQRGMVIVDPGIDFTGKKTITLGYVEREGEHFRADIKGESSCIEFTGDRKFQLVLKDD